MLVTSLTRRPRTTDCTLSHPDSIVESDYRVAGIPSTLRIGKFETGSAPSSSYALYGLPLSMKRCCHAEMKTMATMHVAERSARQTATVQLVEMEDGAERS